jgi:hypothetical protein
MLKNGEVLLIYPGGVREAVLSDNCYGLNWRENAGFAKLAIKAQVVIYLQEIVFRIVTYFIRVFI